MGKDRTPPTNLPSSADGSDPISMLKSMEGCLQMAVGLVTGLVLESDGAPDAPFARMMDQVAEDGPQLAVMVGALAKVGQILVAGLAQHSGVSPADICARLGQFVAEMDLGVTLADPHSGGTFILRRGPR